MAEKVFNVRLTFLKTFPFLKVKAAWGDLDLKQIMEANSSPFLLKVFNQKYKLLTSLYTTIESDLYKRIRTHGRVTIEKEKGTHDLVVTDWSNWSSDESGLVLNITVYDPSADKRPLRERLKISNSWEHLYGEHTRTKTVVSDTAYRSLKKND